MAEQDELSVLLIHGQSHDLVHYFVNFFAALGLSASSAIDLPAGGRTQKEKVDYLIETARLILVLATFNEDEPSGRSARPNVYHELTTSLAHRSRDTIVLQEERGDIRVELGSNLVGQTVVIPFSQAALHRVLPPILKELRDHKLIAAVPSNQSTFEAGTILNAFLDEMDNIWDNQFDVAWDKIVHTSADHESDFATELDKFFQAYQNVFSGLIRHEKRGADLESLARENLGQSWGLASRAWEIVADAKRAKASGLVSTRKNKEHPVFHNALRLIAQAKREPDPKVRIEMFREAVDLLDTFISRGAQ